MTPDPIFDNLSVIVPVHGSVHDLRSCLRSLSEVLSLGAEGILVLDGPNISLFEVAKLFQAERKSVSVFIRPKSGPGPVRNFGIQSAGREYVYFLDIDDRLNLPGFIRNFRGTMKHKPDVVRATAKVESRISSRETGSGLHQRRYPTLSPTVHLLQGGPLNRFVSRGKNIATSSGLHLFRRQFLLKHELEFDRESPEEDIRFVNLAYYYAESLLLSPEEIFIRTIRDGSLSTQPVRVSRRPYLSLVVEVAQIDRDRSRPSFSRLCGFGKAMLEKELKRLMRLVFACK